MRVLLLLLLISFAVVSCGYRLGGEDSLASQTTISIPYVQGDDDGLLTETLIRAIAANPQFSYVSKGGVLSLEAKIISDRCDHIGYQYDRDPLTGARIHRLVPNEGRREIIVEFSLVNARSNVVIIPPTTVKASSDYDFVDSDSLQDTSFLNRWGARESALFFSMGQLDSMEGAQAAARKPLYAQLVQKIIDGFYQF
ncbi:MAG: hypothetical protein KDK60_03230 [Chlamydiia bacterium]|nr:hypothetical protein [Chlamydiia bacterium]